LQLLAYQGYYENGLFHSEGMKMQLPVRRKMTIILEGSFTQESKVDEQEISARLEIVKSLRGIIPSGVDVDALREERLAKRGAL